MCEFMILLKRSNSTNRVNKNKLFMKKYVSELLDKIEECSYEVRFTSISSDFENYLIHLFFDNRIYAIRLHEKSFGISKVDGVVESLNAPDKDFQSWNDFQTELENILCQ
jgi:hypothetical protein